MILRPSEASPEAAWIPAVSAFESLFQRIGGGRDFYLRAALTYQPFPDQVPILEALANHRRVCGVAGRRYGKTLTMLCALLSYAHNFDFAATLERFPHRPPEFHPRFAYIAPTEKQALEIAWDVLRTRAAELGGSSSTADGIHKVFVPCIGGTAEILVLGAQNPDFQRGSYLDGVILDEFAKMNPNMRTKVVLPMLGDYGGFEWVIGTPWGKNHFYHLFNQYKADPECATFYIPGHTVERMASVYAQIRRDMGTDRMARSTYRQEVECDWDAPVPGAFWEDQLDTCRARGGMGHFPHVPGHPVYVSGDLGVSDPISLWFFQLVDGMVRWIDHVERRDMSLSWIAQTLQERATANSWNYGRLFMPHDIKARDISKGDPETHRAVPRHNVLREELKKRGVAIVIMLVPYTRRLDSIDVAKLVIDRSCFNTDNRDVDAGVAALQSYSREWSDELQTFRREPRHDWASHASDAFRGASTVITANFKNMAEWSGAGESRSTELDRPGPLHAELAHLYGDDPGPSAGLPTGGVVH